MNVAELAKILDTVNQDMEVVVEDFHGIMPIIVKTYDPVAKHENKFLMILRNEKR